MAGRGNGKTRTGGETVRQWKDEYPRIALVAPTTADIRKVLIEGESGILSQAPPWDRPIYEPSKGHKLTWPNGAVAFGFSAEEPDRLRGPQHHAAWCDEIAAWKNLDETWDNLFFGLRLGDDPRCLATTTPKPLKLIRELLADPDTVVTRGSTYDNAAHLAPKFLKKLLRKYEGTRLGRQELMAELLTDIPGALWTRDLIEASRVELRLVPPMWRVVVSIDPAVSAAEGSDETGIIAAGVGLVAGAWHGYVLEDRTGRYKPAEWGRIAIDLLRKWRGDRIVAEVNNGGDMVEANIRSCPGGSVIPFRAVHATRGKAVRAEPASSLYEQKLIHHVTREIGPGEQSLEALEDQLCIWVPGSGEKSPDRLDALVWALWDLIIEPAAETGLVIADYSEAAAISVI